MAVTIADAGTTGFWRCPLCPELLGAVEGGLGCGNGHRFDRSKEGYVNLLPAQHRNSRKPGDSRAMVRARRDFFAAGHYGPLATRVVSLLMDHAPASSSPVFLDVGCGEGYYSRAIGVAFSAAGRPPRCFGIDISRDAVALAARASRQHPKVVSQFAVASSFRLPVADGTVDAAIRIFAPVDESEVARVLIQDGVEIRVEPAPDHLYELREHVYDIARPHEEKASAPGEGFVALHTENIRFAVDLRNPVDVANLFAMTPYYWQASEARRTQIGEIMALSVQAHFRLTVVQRKH